MTVHELLDYLQGQGVALSLKNGDLVVQGKKQALKDATLVQRMRDNKPALIALIQSGAYKPVRAATLQVPPNAIPAGCQFITPAMLPLVQLSQEQVDRIAATVPGGCANVQDIYPLAPLQEGILFHHLMARQGDAYLMPTLFRFQDRCRLDTFMQALQAVVDRHDVLRTAVLWDDLPEPVQVVWRHAPLALQELPRDAANGDVTEQLRHRFDRNSHRINLSQAPMLRAVTVQDGRTGHWTLLLLMHHLAIDHTALDIIQDEVHMQMTGRSAELPPPLPFRNFVAQARLGTPQEEHEAFFRKMLGDVDAPTAPFGLADVQGDGSANAEAQQLLDVVLALRMRRCAVAANVSVASLCHLAWALVLARTAGREDVVFGTLLFGRMRGGEGADRVVGLFINTLPLRVRVDHAGVLSSLREVHRLLAQLIGHEHAPLALAQRCSGLAAPSPLFSAVLNYRHSAAAKTSSPTEREVWDGVELLGTEERTNYPFTMTVDDLGVGFALTARADVSVEPQRVCAFMNTALERLVGALERAPATPLSGLDVLPATERELVLTTWNTTEAAFAHEHCVHELFEGQVAATPSATALVQGERLMRYDELNQQANRLAHRLREMGVGPECRVALCLEPDAHMVVAVLAVLKAGGAYVPLDPAYPAERLNYMLQDSTPVVLFVHGGVPTALQPAATTQVLDLQNDTAQWALRSGENLPRTDTGLRPDHLAYVIYTSGSTGQPKGVMVEHRSVCNLTQAQIDAFAIEPDSRVLQFASVSFDACVSEVMTALCRGACLVLPPPGILLAGTALVEVIEQHAISHVTLPPAVLAALAEDARLDSLSTLVVAGDACPPSVLQRFGPDRRFINAYGPTEATVCATLQVCKLSDGVPGIGRPIANTRVYLLDARKEPVPIGVPGEIFVAGVGVARGYLHRPELTAERFMADPFHGGRMYRTGDLARHRSDGSLDFLGRNDFQVKLRGYRIELGEIEARLVQHPTVREAVVMAREDLPGEQRLVAYYTEAEEAPADFDWSGFIASATGHDGIDTHDPHQKAQELRAHLAALLPEYMLPAAYVRLEQLPLTPNGKLDRKALPAPGGQAYAARAYEAPFGEVEISLAKLWSELLGVPQVGRHDDFFALGGHSLLAVRVVSRLRQELDVELSLGDLFTHRLLAELAEAVGAARRSELPPITVASRSEPLPLSFAQARLWFLAQLPGQSRAYHMVLGLQLTGALDRAALGRALDRIVARHESLRTHFVVCESQPMQRVAPADIGFMLQEHDLRGQADATTQAHALATAEADAAFDLDCGPLVRGRLIALDDKEHVLLITIHHIVSDGWSMGVLTRELGALYRAFVQGQGDPLAPLAIQYADYAAWQRKWMGGELLRRQSTYWKQQLGGAPALLELPTDRVRPTLMDHRGAMAVFTLDTPLSTALKAFSLRHGSTLYMTLLSAWAAVLSRLTGQQDIVIGTPVANRGMMQVEGLIGLFINTLALRLDLRDSPSSSTLLQRVKAATLQAQAHQDLPFEQVVELLNPQRSTAHTPLFQVMFDWQQGDDGALELPGLQLQAVAAPHAISKVDLTLFMGETDGCIHGAFEFATALFDAPTIERFSGYLRKLLQAMVADEHLPVDQIDMLGAAERHQVLIEWNATDTDYPREQGIHELFEQQVAKTPEAIAVVHDDEQLSYAELNARANRLAHHLLGLGVQTGQRVALLLERSIALVVAELAVLKCGACFVPLDHNAPLQRQAFLIADSQAVRVISKIELDTVDLHAYPSENPVRASSTASHGEAPAYVMYTSGSTGQPKGVVVPHRAISRVVIRNGYADFCTSDRVAFAANPAFDASTMEVWAALLNGGCLVVIGQATLMQPQAFQQALLRHHVNVMWLTVGLFNQYAQALSDVFTQLRYLVVGGDALEPSVIRHVLAHSPPQHLINGYGPTESTVFAITHLIRQVGEGARSVPIGRPIANTRIYLLDAQHQPVPIGVAGEIHIAGDGLALGYLNHAELTAQRFIENPFHGGRMYKTGDLARYLPDGNIEFLGRNDQQVKIRGFRIELGEIEARLAQQPGIREAVVLARNDDTSGKRLVAYCTRDASAQDIDAEVLRGQLMVDLPEYMLPAAYVWLENLPLTPNGKLDRQALPEPHASAFASQAFEAPQGQTEETLAQIWGELLQLPRVGRHDDFFALGGHSLLAVSLVSRLRQELGVELGVAELFAHPALSALAVAVNAARRSELPPITAVNRDEAMPLSFAQARLWFVAQMDEHSHAYNMPLGLRLTGPLDRAALRRALDGIVARHEALRTCFVQRDGQPMQCIAPAELGFALIEHDLRAHPDATTEARLLAAAETSATFDLQAGPLIRGRLIMLADEEHALLITMHHIVSDGWSMGIFFNELSALYAAALAGHENPLPPLAIQYADYAAWQRAWLHGEALARQTSYWRTSLSGAPALMDLPTDRPRPAQQDFAGGFLPIAIDAALTRDLRAVSRAHGVTLFMTVLTGWAIVLSRLSGQHDLVIGTGAANRTTTELEGLIGFFINTLALRIDLAGACSTHGALQRVKAVAMGAQAHQDLPFEQVVELAQPDRSAAYSALFQVMFAWQNTEQGALTLPGLTVEGLGLSLDAVKFDLELTLGEADGKLIGGLSYATALFDAATAQRMVGYLVVALRALVADEQPLDGIDLLPASERHQLLVDWNQTTTDWDTSTCIQELFEAQAVRTPDAVAVGYGDTRLSYRALNEQANRLAHFLRDLGVGPDMRVAVCVERRPYLLIGLLAILKAGGAYVPLDPSYPAERLAYLLADSDPTVVLVDAAGALSLGDGGGGPRLMLDGDELPWSDAPAGNLAPEAIGLQPDHLAYVIYTSGSSGQPKGVMALHRGLVNLATALAARYAIGAHSRVLQFVSPSFDVSLSEVVMAWAAGASLWFADKDELQLGSVLTATLHRLGITHLSLAASGLGFLSEDTMVGQTIITGGEPLLPALAQRWAQRHVLFNNYGPTETTVTATVHQCEAELVSSVSIGRPIANVQIYLLDTHGQPVPVGATGEIYIGGVGVARGYLNRPELTAERFVLDPFSGVRDARLYRTGDLARYRADGTLTFVGRNDFQVKVRGFRIELGEIEARLAEHPAVHEAVVVAREDAGDKRLVAYFTPRAETAPLVHKLLHMEQADPDLRAQLHEVANGLPVFHKNRRETDLIYSEIFESLEYLQNGIHLHDGCCIFDVGANIGLFSLFMSRRYPGAQIYAFEPIEPLYRCVRLNQELHGIQGLAFNVGLSNRNGDARFRFYPKNTAASTSAVSVEDTRSIVRAFLHNDAATTDARTLDGGSVEDILDAQLTYEEHACQLRRLSDVIAEQSVQHIDLLKIDVEGAELDVLHGIDAQDWPRIGQVVIEVHDVDGRLQTIGALLAARGFVVSQHQSPLLANTGLYTLYAIHRDYQPVDSAAPLAGTSDAGWNNLNGLVQGLRAHLARVLPEHAMPAAFVAVPTFALSPNGKLDRDALPDPTGLALAKRRYEAPLGAIETALARHWCELLGVQAVGRHDHFFELGGHSLLALQLLSRVLRDLGVELQLASLFAHASLSALADLITAASATALPPITCIARDERMPLSYAQQRLWFLGQLDGIGAAYHLPLGLHLSGPLDGAALRRSLDHLIARHEALRASFYVDEGQPFVRLAPADTGFMLVTHDLRGHADPATEAKLLAGREAASSFNMELGPLIRGRLIVLGEEEHVLLITMHHIVSDGWSLGVLTKELSALYGAYSQGEGDPLAPLPIQYADYAAWQRRWLEGEVLQRQCDHWKQRLSDAPAWLELPTDRPRPSHQDHRGAIYSIDLGDSLSAELGALSQRHGTTLFMTLLSAWAALMSRLSGQDDVVIGTPVANRTRVEVEGLIGFFVNTLALRIDMGDGPSTVDLLRRVKAETLQAQAHQDLPFEQVVELINPPRSLAYSPLFQVMFSWQNAAPGAVGLPGLTLRTVGAGHEISKFDLTLHMGEGAGHLGGAIEYATALFDEATIARYAGYLKTLLAAMVANEQQSVDSLQILGAAERHQLLVGWNATDVDYPHDRCLHQLFEAQAERTPQAVAVVHDGGEWRYGELNARANRLAHQLRNFGVLPGDCVAVLLERSAELVCAQLAILKCAAAYVPLDQNAPSERQAFMIGDCQARIVLSVAQLSVPEHPGTLRVNLDELVLDMQPTHNPHLAMDSEAVACVMYTSGSTGQPKGVLVPHRAIGRLVLNNHYAHFNAFDRVAFTANPAFDSSNMEVWATLLHGARIVVIGNAMLLDAGALAQRLKQTQATILHLVAGLLGAYAEALAGVFPQLRYLLTGGDVAAPRAIARVLRESAPKHLVHCYGPSETATFATTCELVAVADDAKSVPIGRPIANTRVYLLDRHLEPVPTGVAAELYIGGAGVALGYLNRPELTAERFVADPFTGGTLYKTGDLVRYRHDGDIEFIGRNDQQVKIRGYRIELGEIETQLAQHPGIRESVVLAREDQPGEKRLVAYFVADGTPIDVQALRSALAATLPEYMLPAAFVRLDQMPLTLNGKLDRKALPEPDLQAAAACAFEAPQGKIETALSVIWAEVLGLERVGRHDHFFELGGHSLLSIKLLARIERDFGVKFSLSDFLEQPTMAAMAGKVIHARLARFVPEELAALARAQAGTTNGSNTA